VTLHDFLELPNVLSDETYPSVHMRPGVRRLLDGIRSLFAKRLLVPLQLGEGFPGDPPHALGFCPGFGLTGGALV
jgi:hypothetical protein